MTYKTRTPWAIAAGLAALAVILLVAVGCANLSAKLTPGASQTERYSSAVSNTGNPLQVSMTMRGRPALGATVDVDLSVKSSLPAPTTTMTLTVPVTSVEFVTGETRAANIQSAEDPYYGSVTQAAWPLSLAQDQAQSMTAALRITQNGYYNIHAYAFTDLGAGEHYGGLADLYLVVDGTEVWVGDQPPKNNWKGSFTGPAGTRISPETSPIQARLSLADALSFEKETELVYEVTALANLENLTLGITLPAEGLKIIDIQTPRDSDLALVVPRLDASPLWVGNMVQGQRITIRVRLKPVLTGEGVISAFVSQQVTNEVLLLSSTGLNNLKVYVPRLAE